MHHDSNDSLRAGCGVRGDRADGGSRTARKAFLASVARVPDSRYLFNNTCQDILAVAGRCSTASLDFRRGRFDVAFEHLRRAIALDDGLPYDEPWGWMQPTRHA